MRESRLELMGFVVVLTLGLSLGLSQNVFAQETELPPGISKKETIPGKGLHKGWEQGKHKGWDKDKDKKNKEGKRDIKQDKKGIGQDTREIKEEKRGLPRDIKERKKDVRELNRDKRERKQGAGELNRQRGQMRGSKGK